MTNIDLSPELAIDINPNEDGSNTCAWHVFVATTKHPGTGEAMFLDAIVEDDQPGPLDEVGSAELIKALPAADDVSWTNDITWTYADTFDHAPTHEEIIAFADERFHPKS